MRRTIKFISRIQDVFSYSGRSLGLWGTGGTKEREREKKGRKSMYSDKKPYGIIFQHERVTVPARIKKYDRRRRHVPRNGLSPLNLLLFLFSQTVDRDAIEKPCFFVRKGIFSACEKMFPGIQTGNRRGEFSPASPFMDCHSWHICRIPWFISAP